jgi:protein-S-isoprenylcysteine O-methyltransferase Ste14
MKAFRVARTAPTWRHVVATLLQTAGFWTLFLAVLPALLVASERRLGLPPLALPGHRWLGGALFVAASALGLTTGVVMAVLGRGTPLPLATARELVRRGPYRRLRNPMALAGITQGFAVGLWCDSVLVALYALAGAVLWHGAARPAEERDLAARFGDAFGDYRRAVPLWLPRLGGRAVERALAGALALGAAALLTTAADRTAAWQRLPFGLALLLLAAQLASSARVNATNAGQNAAKSSSSPR